MFKSNVEVESKPVKIGGWRKSALSTWKMSKDCSIYCPQTINVGPALEYVKRLHAESEYKVTLTHLAVRACAKLTKENPEINRLLRNRKLYQRTQVNISVLAANPNDPQNLSNIRFVDADKMDLFAIAKRTSSRNRNIKEGKDTEHKFMKNVMKSLPQRFVDLGMYILEKILYGLNIWSPLINFPKDSFGNIMISNVGYMGMQSVFVPLVPWTRAPLMLAIGKIYDKAVVREGKIVVETSMDCFWTCDHRLVDGLVGAKMLNSFEKYMTRELDLL